MKLATARLELQSWTLDDAAEAHALWGDPHVMRHVGQHHDSPRRTEAALEAAMAAEQVEGVCLWRLTTRTGEPVGCCGFHRYDGPGSRAADATEPWRSDWLELAYHLRPSCWGQGYATEAARACLKLAPDLGASHVVAFTAWRHVASRRVLDKLGFRRAGCDEASGEFRHLLFVRQVYDRCQ
jgi:RimJ/RimL family protein N-acetyltransferase